VQGEVVFALQNPEGL